MKVLVYIDQREGKIKSIAWEALTLAHTMAGSSAQVAAVLVGDAVGGSAGEIAGWGADAVFVADHASLKNFNVMSYAKAVGSAVDTFKPDLIIAGATPMGRELLPRLVARFSAGILTDVTSLKASGDKLSATKPMYSGKCIGNMEMKKGKLNIVSIRPNVFAAKKCGEGSASVQSIAADGFADERLKTVEIRKGKSERPDLTEASVIVSGGRSVGSADNFKIIFECADAIGATVGASRAAVDAGYATHDMQVGQTGKTVNPNLYIACGISGAIQHMAGMRSSKVIVAINTDPEAPIFTIADYGIVADLFEAVPKLTEEFKKMMG